MIGLLSYLNLNNSIAKLQASDEHASNRWVCGIVLRAMGIEPFRIARKDARIKETEWPQRHSRDTRITARYDA